MSETRSNSNWQTWMIGAMGTLLLSISSLYMSNLNAQSKETSASVVIIRERLATVEEAAKQIGELKASIEKLTNAVNESNKRNPRQGY